MRPDSTDTEVGVRRAAGCALDTRWLGASAFLWTYLWCENSACRGSLELAFGAIASGVTLVLNQSIVQSCRLTEKEIQSVARAENIELLRRESTYRGSLPPLDLNGKTVILVDDGLATGATMRAAVKAVRFKHPQRIIIAVPVGSVDTCEELGQLSEVMGVCATTPEPL